MTITMGASGGNVDQIRVLTVVPEPATVALFVLGLPVLARAAGRRRGR